MFLNVFLNIISYFYYYYFLTFYCVLKGDKKLPLSCYLLRLWTLNSNDDDDDKNVIKKNKGLISKTIDLLCIPNQWIVFFARSHWLLNLGVIPWLILDSFNLNGHRLRFQPESRGGTTFYCVSKQHH